MLEWPSGYAQAGYNLIDDRPGDENTPEDALRTHLDLEARVATGAAVVGVGELWDLSTDNSSAVALRSDGQRLTREVSLELVGDTWYVTTWTECFDGPLGPEVDTFPSSPEGSK